MATSEPAQPDKLLRRVALIGGECTGKTTLVAALAERYRTVHVPEFARDYLIPRGARYTLEQSATIARGQIAREDAIAPKANRVLFCDTEAMATLIWSEYYFGQSHQAVRDLVQTRRYDLYLLTSPDFPWLHDGLRRSPASREWFDQRFQQELESRNLPYVRVSGSLAQRIETAANAIEPLLNVPPP
ncbi:MAG: ATP-binding protein [Phycisphaeraceae bacterium]